MVDRTKIEIVRRRGKNSKLGKQMKPKEGIRTAIQSSEGIRTAKSSEGLEKHNEELSTSLLAISSISMKWEPKSTKSKLNDSISPHRNLENQDL